MNILALDLSTHTGWAYFKDGILTDVGDFNSKVEGYISNVKVYTDIPGCYPANFMKVAKEVARDCLTLWNRLGKPYIVTEHTEGSKHRFSQRLLEWIHYAFFDILPAEPLLVKYILNSDWRRDSHCYISQWPEFIKWNKEIGKLKRKAKPTKSGAKVAKLDGKIVTKVNAKKLSIYISKLKYPDFADRIANDNIADAILLGRAAINLKIFG